MKNMFWATVLSAGALALCLHASEVDDLKADLIGHTMGGREKTWKFQSTDQIKQLVIKSKSDDAQWRVYVVALQLQASKASGKYDAEARVECAKTSTGWKV